MSQDTPFTSQRFVPSRSVITEAERRLGAPWPPLPASFRRLPPKLAPATPPASAEEIAFAQGLRAPFLLPDRNVPYMNDIVRAARLLRGARVYIEVGIFDRGNLAFLSRILAEDALIVGVDIEAEPTRDALIQETILPGQTCRIVIGDSRSPETIAQVASALDGRRADAVFIDGGHDAFTVMHDYAHYADLVADDGLVLFHDSLWEGDAVYKGVADALAEIDRLDPVYLIAGDWPCHRFLRSLWREPLWGVVGVVPMDDRLAARSDNTGARRQSADA